jgi:hypothetical protein
LELKQRSDRSGGQKLHQEIQKNTSENHRLRKVEFTFVVREKKVSDRMYPIRKAPLARDSFHSSPAVESLPAHQLKR